MLPRVLRPSSIDRATAGLPKEGRYSLSARLFVLIVFFVTLSGIVIHVPSIVHYWDDFLRHRLKDAYMSTLIFYVDPAYRPGAVLERELLNQAEIRGIAVRHHHEELPTLVLGRTGGEDARVDLRFQTPFTLTREVLTMLAAGGERTVRVTGAARDDPQVLVSVLIDEKPLWRGMLARSREVLALSLFISLFTAVLVYASLQWLMVRPLHRITRSLVAFREAPDDPGRVIAPSGRGDELGVLERELARMQTELLAALAQRSRLAALGKAVSKINHDFKSILSTVSIASERLARVDDPTVRRIAPLLVDSVERAVTLCTQTQDLARGDQAVPQSVRFKLRNLLEEVVEALKPEGASELKWTIQVPASLEISADRERLYRVFSNLGRNAIEALDGQGEIRISASAVGAGVSIEFADTGSGVPESVRAHLFEPFIGSARPGGMGLGLATARDLVRAHGGDLTLLATGPEGTCFRIELPNSREDARRGE